MRLIQLYDTFLSLGRLAAIMEIGRVAKKTDAQLHSDLIKFCEMATDIAQNFDNAKKLMGVEPTISWPPGDVSDWARISDSFDIAARSDDPRLEVFWRIAGALGWTLWTPIPEGTEVLFREQLLELGLSHGEANDIVDGLLSKEERQRLEAGEQIRKFVRSLSVSDDYQFLRGIPTQQESKSPVLHFPVFHRRSVPLEQDLVFVLMPFTEDWSEYIWKEEIQKSVHQYRSAKLRCKRADDLFGHDVMIDIYESIAKARIVIADITNRNANVFYELGIAHSLGKDVILLSQGTNHIPFDLLRFRHCIYSNDGPGYKKFREYLPRAIESILKNEMSG